jgi:hypothetical protein
MLAQGTSRHRHHVHGENALSRVPPPVLLSYVPIALRVLEGQVKLVRFEKTRVASGLVRCFPTRVRPAVFYVPAIAVNIHDNVFRKLVHVVLAQAPSFAIAHEPKHLRFMVLRIALTFIKNKQKIT